MAEPQNQKNEQRSAGEQRASNTQSAAPANAGQSTAAPAQAGEKREYRVKHKIIMGGRDRRQVLLRGGTLRLTDAEAKRLDDAVEPVR